MKHFIITKFNLKGKNSRTDKGGSIMSTKEWLNHRLNLFQKYCLPSVKNQNNKAF
ncbi:MAG: hypothetical protein JKZ03_04155 [Flavobacteriaceae bacterium]|nr:hypothetical protein [Flavobacteriaceae bacterium]